MNDNVNLADYFLRQISVAGGRGDDKLYVSSHNGTPAHIDGGPGNDDITANLQLGAAPVLRGGTGDDTVTLLNALGGLAYGDAGNDRLVYHGFRQGFNFPLALDGGAGNDTYAFELEFVPTGMVPGTGVDTLDESTADTRVLQNHSLTFDIWAAMATTSWTAVAASTPSSVRGQRHDHVARRQARRRASRSPSQRPLLASGLLGAAMVRAMRSDGRHRPWGFASSLAPNPFMM